MRFALIATFVALLDAAAYFSVPKEVRLQNRWALTPFVGGQILACEYHFGNKLKEPPR